MEYYQGLFSSKQMNKDYDSILIDIHVPVLDLECIESLSRTFTSEEVLASLKDMHPTPSPRRTVFMLCFSALLGNSGAGYCSSHFRFPK